MLTGAVDLLNEVSTSKITGEEDIFSKTDLYDFKANIQGAQKIYEILKSHLVKKDPKLAYRVKHLVIMGTTYDPKVKKPYLELDREKKAQEKEEKKNDSYKKYEESLVYYGTLKQQYLDRLQKKKGE